LPVLILPQDGPADVFTVRLRLPVCERAGVLESVTSTEKIVAPDLVGVPVIAPAEERVSPAGSEVPPARLKA
jgi:hypothetical protein